MTLEKILKTLKLKNMTRQELIKLYEKDFDKFFEYIEKMYVGGDYVTNWYGSKKEYFKVVRVVKQNYSIDIFRDIENHQTIRGNSSNIEEDLSLHQFGGSIKIFPNVQYKRLEKLEDL